MAHSGQGTSLLLCECIQERSPTEQRDNKHMSGLSNTVIIITLAWKQAFTTIHPVGHRAKLNCSYLAGQTTVTRRTLALLHLQSLGQVSVLGHSDIHADPRNTGWAHLCVMRGTDQDIIEVREYHHQVFPGCWHAIGTLPVFLKKKKKSPMSG